MHNRVQLPLLSNNRTPSAKPRNRCQCPMVCPLHKSHANKPSPPGAGFGDTQTIFQNDPSCSFTFIFHLRPAFTLTFLAEWRPLPAHQHRPGHDPERGRHRAWFQPAVPRRDFEQHTVHQFHRCSTPTTTRPVQSAWPRMPLATIKGEVGGELVTPRF